MICIICGYEMKGPHELRTGPCSSEEVTINTIEFRGSSNILAYPEVYVCPRCGHVQLRVDPDKYNEKYNSYYK